MELSEFYILYEGISFKEEDDLELEERLRVIEERTRLLNTTSLAEFLSRTYNL